MDIAFLLCGGLLLYAGAEWLVGGASRLALSLRVSELIVGLTVVAYGTSAPEVIVGVQAARAGLGDIALGNIIGSNIANLGLILGISALVRPARIDASLRRRELPTLLVSTAVLPIVLLDGSVARWEGFVLLGAAAAYTAWMLRTTRGAAVVADAAVTATAATQAGAPPTTSRARHALVAMVGLVALLGGGNLFVESATRVARAHGMSERLVGLTIVAIGTSLPELATGIIAAKRGSSDIAVGNVVGSNIFNVFLCLGVAATFRPIDGAFSVFSADLGVLAAMTVLAGVFMRTGRTMARWEGGVMVAVYVAFVLARVFAR